MTVTRTREEPALELHVAANRYRRRRRARWGATAAGILVLIVILVVATVVIVRVTAPPTAGPRNMLSDGIVLTSTTGYMPTAGIPDGGKPTPTPPSNDGKAHIVIYESAQCTLCTQFWAANATQLAGWLNAGTATVEIHPVAFTESSSFAGQFTSPYAMRAANALGCVAQYDPAGFWAANLAVSLSKPKNPASASAARNQVAALLRASSTDTPSVTSCASRLTFRGWASAALRRLVPPPPHAGNAGAMVSPVPAVTVNGAKYFPVHGWMNAAGFAAFVKNPAATIG